MKYDSNFRRFAVAFLAMAAVVAGAAPESFAQDDTKSEKPKPPGKITFVGKNLVATANGTFHNWKFTKAKYDGNNLEEAEFEIEVDVASIDTGIEKRDNHLRTSDFFDVENHPTATIKITDIKRKGQSEAGHDLYSATFDLTIHGVRKQMDFEFEVTDRSPLTVQGKTVLNRMAFKIGEPHAVINPMSIKEEIPVEFSATMPPSK